MSVCVHICTQTQAANTKKTFATQHPELQYAAHNLNRHTWCGRKVMREATLCTNRQCCCLPLHMAVRLTPAIDSVQV